jgi:hypothetical protein
MIPTLQMGGAGRPPVPPIYLGKKTISAGGTYTGNWMGASGAEAVEITTTEAVTLLNCRIKGNPTLNLIKVPTDVNLTMENCVSTCNPPPSYNDLPGRLLNTQSGTLSIQRCTLYKGGIYLQGADNRAITIKYNKGYNFEGRYGDGAGGYRAVLCGQTRQFFQINGPRDSTAIEIAWNQIVNKANESATEDVISIYETSGTSGNHMLVHDNFIHGAYSIDPENNAGSYSGGGILTDGGNSGNLCAYIDIYSNQIVSTQNYAIAINNGHDISIHDNTGISSGKLTADGPRLAYLNIGAIMWEYNGWSPSSTYYYNNVMSNNYLRWSDTAGTANPGWYPAAANTGCSVSNDEGGEVSFATQEAEWGTWATKLSGAGITQLGSTLRL